jgi:hypothetical protein
MHQDDGTNELDLLSWNIYINLEKTFPTISALGAIPGILEKMFNMIPGEYPSRQKDIYEWTQQGFTFGWVSKTLLEQAVNRFLSLEDEQILRMGRNFEPRQDFLSLRQSFFEYQVHTKLCAATYILSRRLKIQIA